MVCPEWHCAKGGHCWFISDEIIKYYEDNIDKLLKELENHNNPNAQFRTIIALIYKHEEFIFEGVIKGKSELYEYLFEKSGITFLNIDDPLQRKWINKLNSFTFGEDNNANCQIKYMREKFKPLSISFEKKTIKSETLQIESNSKVQQKYQFH